MSRSYGSVIKMSSIIISIYSSIKCSTCFFLNLFLHLPWSYPPSSCPRPPLLAPPQGRLGLLCPVPSCCPSLQSCSQTADLSDFPVLENTPDSFPTQGPHPHWRLSLRPLRTPCSHGRTRFYRTCWQIPSKTRSPLSGTRRNIFSYQRNQPGPLFRRIQAD